MAIAVRSAAAAAAVARHSLRPPLAAPGSIRGASLLPPQRSRRGPVSRPRSRGELLRDWRWRAPSSAVQRGADDGLDGQPLPDARAADLEARVALHGDGGRGDHRASER
ncbi:hypothetical protein EE612_022775 [Oryza sativa]|nr:hypothetical protein EE612_022775 [Oryza sativa]